MLQLIVNKFLALDPGLHRYLRMLQDKHIAVICTDFPNHKVYCTFEENQVLFNSSAPTKIDAEISGTLTSFIHFALTKQNDDLKISGDAAIAQLVAKLYFELNIDWEEELSKYTGDAIAYQSLNMLRKFRQYQTEARTSIADMICEYLQEESGLVPTHYEVEDFMQNVDNLRLRVDRLEARIKAYEDN